MVFLSPPSLRWSKSDWDRSTRWLRRGIGRPPSRSGCSIRSTRTCLPASWESRWPAWAWAGWANRWSANGWSRGERLMMANVLDLEDKSARQVMVPRRDTAFLRTRRPLPEKPRVVTESRHPRGPLCDGDLDRVVGMVHPQDLLNAVTSREE